MWVYALTHTHFVRWHKAEQKWEFAGTHKVTKENRTTEPCDEMNRIFQWVIKVIQVIVWVKGRQNEL